MLNLKLLKTKSGFSRGLSPNKPFIINAISVDISLPFETLTLESDDKNLSTIDDILTVDEYFKICDTKLSR